MSEQRSERAVYAQTKQAVTNGATFDPRRGGAITLSVLPSNFPQQREKQRGSAWTFRHLPTFTPGSRRNPPVASSSRGDVPQRTGDVPLEEARLGPRSLGRKNTGGGRFSRLKQAGKTPPNRRDLIPNSGSFGISLRATACVHGGGGSVSAPDRFLCFRANAARPSPSTPPLLFCQEPPCFPFGKEVISFPAFVRG